MNHSSQKSYAPALAAIPRISRLLETYRAWMIEDDVIRNVVNPSINRLSVLAALGKMVEDGLIEADVELIGEDEMGPTRNIYRWCA